MDSNPPNLDLKDPNVEYKEEIPSNLPYEEPPDVIDVGDIKANDRIREMRRYAILSSIAYDMYSHGYDKAQENMKEHLPLHNLDPELSDDYSVVAVKKHLNKPNDVIISYRGTADLKDVLYTWGPIAAGLPSEKLLDTNLGYYGMAQNKYDLVKAKYPNANITTTGHSLGGSEAFVIGKKNNVKNYIFNAGSSPLDNLTNLTNKDTAENKTIHYYVPGDPVGGSRAIFSNEELVKVEPHKWLRDVAKTFGSNLVNPDADIGSVLTKKYWDIHGLHNFLPPSTFKEEVEPDDILYRWISPIHYEIKEESQVSRRGNFADFSQPKIIERREFIENYKKCLNPFDPKCQLRR